MSSVDLYILDYFTRTNGYGDLRELMEKKISSTKSGHIMFRLEDFVEKCERALKGNVKELDVKSPTTEQCLNNNVSTIKTNSKTSNVEKIDTPLKYVRKSLLPKKLPDGNIFENVESKKMNVSVHKKTKKLSSTEKSFNINSSTELEKRVKGEVNLKKSVSESSVKKESSSSDSSEDLIKADLPLQIIPVLFIKNETSPSKSSKIIAAPKSDKIKSSISISKSKKQKKISNIARESSDSDSSINGAEHITSDVRLQKGISRLTVKKDLSCGDCIEIEAPSKSMLPKDISKLSVTEISKENLAQKKFEIKHCDSISATGRKHVSQNKTENTGELSCCDSCSDEEELVKSKAAVLKRISKLSKKNKSFSKCEKKEKSDVVGHNVKKMPVIKQLSSNDSFEKNPENINLQNKKRPRDDSPAKDTKRFKNLHGGISLPSAPTLVFTAVASKDLLCDGVASVNSNNEDSICEQEQQDLLSVTEPCAKLSERRRTNSPFRRVKSENVVVDKYFEKFNDYDFRGTWGEQAMEKLKHVRGKDFRREKNKKKRGGYKGGKIDFSVRSITFDD